MAGQKIGIVIGNNYPNSDKELKFAVSDAEKMKEILENKDICGFDNVSYFSNKGSREVSIAVDKILRKADNDLIFIYYSGHGKKDHEGKLCLLFNDTDEEALVATSLTFDFINKCLKYPSRKSTIIVLDCCYSGVAGIKNCDTDVMEEFKRLSGSGTIILTSTGSTGSPTAREDEKLGHGIFTYYLIEGLEKGTADVDDDGLISIDELYDYAYKKTRENSTQSPKREGNIEGKVFIGTCPQKINDDEYKLKAKKLFEFRNSIPYDILERCQTILRESYCTPSLLNKDDNLILVYLKDLLNDNLLPEKINDKVQNLIEAVQLVKEAEDRRQKEEAERKQREDLEKYKKETYKNLDAVIRFNKKIEVERKQREELEKYKKGTYKNLDAVIRFNKKVEAERKQKGEAERNQREGNERNQREREEEARELEEQDKLPRLKEAAEKPENKKRKLDVYVVTLGIILILGIVMSYTLIQKMNTTNSSNDNVSLVDTANNDIIKAAVPLGNGNMRIAVNPDGSKVYAAGSDNNVSVIDTAKNTVIATISVGNGPEGMAITPDGSNLYVANKYGNSVSVIDTTKNAVKTKVVIDGYPSKLAISPDGKKVYVTNEGNNYVHVIDTATNKVIAKVHVGYNPRGIAITPDGKKVYVANYMVGDVSVIDTATNNVTNEVKAGRRPYGVAINPEGTKIYVSNFVTENINVIDTATNNVTATVYVGGYPTDITVNHAGSKVYVVMNGNICIFDTATNNVVGTVDIGNSSYGLAVNPDGSKVYVVGSDNNVSVIDTATNTVIATVRRNQLH